MNISLDGDWTLVLDPEDQGVARRWFQEPDMREGIQARVPAVWDLWAPDYDGVGWYFRRFEAGAEFRGQYAELRFEAVDYYAEVWLNGERLGEHEGGYTPFAFDASHALREGDNLLVVRVIDPDGPAGFGDFRPDEFPSSKQSGYWSFAGIWGSVSLIAKPPAHIQDVFIEPDIRRKRIAVTVDASEPGDIRATIEGTPFSAEGAAGRIVVEFPEHELWSPDTPNLYTLKCELIQDGRTVHETSTRFGMREFTVKENRFYLNNHPIFIKGVLHQPDYARSLAGPETEDVARRELQAAKDAGFNLVRLHIRPAPRITLELADEIGLLLYEEPAIGWIKKSQWMRERCEREVREMVLRDRNHPSVVIWGMLNETGNAGYVTGGGAQSIKDDLCRLARSLDPSRLIIDDSGGVNASRETSRLMRPYHDEFEPYDDLHIYQRAPVDRDIELYYAHSGEPNLLYFLSEMGFGGMEDLVNVIGHYGEQRRRLKDARFLQAMLDAMLRGYEERNLDRVFGSFSNFTAAARELQCDAARHQIDACRANPKLAGYCYTQLCDAGHEFCAGILDRWRRPKPVMDTLRQVNRRIRPIIHLPRTNLAPREEVPVTVTLINEEHVEGRADLSLQVVGPTNQVLWKKKRGAKIPRSGKELWTGTISASGSPGTHKFVVRLLQGVTCLAESSVDLHVFEPAEPCNVSVNILDPLRAYTDKCAALTRIGTVAAPVHVVPPLANTIRAYPDNELAEILAQAKGGAVAIIFAPPDDWNDLADRLDPSIRATSKDAVGAFLGAYHYVKFHPVFDSLPARGLMRQPYRNTVPPKTFVESGDEDICGTFDTSPAGAGQYMMEERRWWGNDILIRKYGSGRVVFTHLRILENLGQDPVADHLFVNLLKHFSRRSVPPEGLYPLDQKAVEWLRRERNDRIRRWMVIGPFANWGDKGHSTAYPPEQNVQFEATYPGWYTPVHWKAWYSRAEDAHVVDLQQAFTPVYEYYPRFDYGTGYAYAEITSDKRVDAIANLGIQDATKVWLNGKLVYETDRQIPHDRFATDSAECTFKHGRNTLLVKVSKIPGPFKFSIDFEAAREPLVLKWWK